MKSAKIKSESQLFNESHIVAGLRAAESKRYGKYAKRAFDMFEKVHGHQPDKLFMATMGHQLAQFDSWRQDEGVSQASIPVLRDYGFELITVLFPGLIANDLFNVQPAKFKNYSIFYQDYLHGTAKGGTALNSRMIGSLLADQIDSNYTRDAEVNKVVGTGTGSNVNFVLAGGNLFVPIVPGTVVLYATKQSDSTTMTIIDNGTTGALTGDIGAGTNTISYTTGALNVDFVAAVKNGTSVYLTYEFIGEGSETNAAQLDLTISEKQGVAKERRLRFNYTIEGQYAYKQQFGRSMDADLLAAAIADTRAEIDADLILSGYNASAVLTGATASAGSITWDRTPDAGVQYFYWREQFIDTLHSGGNLIIQSTGFGEGNKVVGGINFKQVVETLGPRVKLDSVAPTAKGARKIGTIDGTIDCYYSPQLGDNAFFQTFKGGPLQIGLTYNPWMPLYTSDPHMLDNGKLHRYLITAYGKLVINPKLFVLGTLTKS